MKLRPEELKKGEVYFMRYKQGTELVFRFKEHKIEINTIYYFSALYTDSVRVCKNNYCHYNSFVTELRPATEAEKAKLVKYGAESNSSPVKEFVTIETADKYQQFFNFLNQEHGLVCTIEQMNEIMREAVKLDKKLKE